MTGDSASPRAAYDAPTGLLLIVSRSNWRNTQWPANQMDSNQS